MPCTYEDDGQRNHHLMMELNKVTDMLCRILTQLDILGREDIIATHPDIISWWYFHKAKDREKLERIEAGRAKEALRRGAINKLTDEELKALGLNR